MIDTQMLDRAKQEFDADGFTVLRGYFDPEQTRRLIVQVDRYMQEVVPRLPPTEIFYEDKNQPDSIMRLERMHQSDPYFKNLLGDPRLVELAGKLLDDVALPQDLSMFGKAPRIGKPTPPHQDGNYFMLEPNEALTYWIPVDRADLENGCLHYVRGSHLRGMRKHELSEVFGFSLGIADFGPVDQAREVCLTVDPGDVLVHHSLTIHRTDANPSPRLRRALGATYYAQRARPNDQARMVHTQRVKAKWKEAGKL